MEEYTGIKGGTQENIEKKRNHKKATEESAESR